MGYSPLNKKSFIYSSNKFIILLALLPPIDLSRMVSGRGTQSISSLWLYSHVTGSIRESFLCGRLIFHEVLFFLTSELPGISSLCLRRSTLVSWTLVARCPILRYRTDHFLHLFSLKQHHVNSSFVIAQTSHVKFYTFLCVKYTVYSVFIIW